MWNLGNMRGMILLAGVFALTEAVAAADDISPEEQFPTQAETFLIEVMGVWAGDAEKVLAWCDGRYTETVDYYGKQVPYRTVYDDKRHFLKRWPVRHYAVRPGSIHVHCEADLCHVEGIVDWEVESPSHATRSGVATAHYTLIMRPGTTPFISGEDSDVVVRR